MALDAGNEACTTGLSKRIFDNLTASWSPDFTPGAEWKIVSYSVAKGLVDEIVANSEIILGIATIKTTDSGLQRDPASTDDCLGPSVEKELTVVGSVG